MKELATLGGGCFWCIEAVFLSLNGVLKAQSGYAGGLLENPTYKQVCTGNTGHAEVVQVTFDNSKTSFESILRLFFKAHDPTTLNRQGADIGTQYRSAIFYHSEDQKNIAMSLIKDIQKDFKDPIVTEIKPFTKFWPAEDFHNNYYALNKSAPYCRSVIKPKLDKLNIQS